ncbi:Hypothetical predicted protein [Lecanosticta acicola]|uniref:Uncharacterized protein n=1 Tax=Lecanosticta acicola TaxID=111012 RepID=A0AAI8YSY1_9PEZI|nr:Hypothetical predicted protein [Lecanosticta acicola]
MDEHLRQAHHDVHPHWKEELVFRTKDALDQHANEAHPPTDGNSSDLAELKRVMEDARQQQAQYAEAVKQWQAQVARKDRERAEQDIQREAWFAQKERERAEAEKQRKERFARHTREVKQGELRRNNALIETLGAVKDSLQNLRTFVNSLGSLQTVASSAEEVRATMRELRQRNEENNESDDGNGDE